MATPDLPPPPLSPRTWPTWLLVGLGWMFSRLPSSFLPVEDQGYTITDIQLPPGASKNRTVQVAEQIEAHNAEEPGVGDTTMIMGFSFSGSGQTAALADIWTDEAFLSYSVQSADVKALLHFIESGERPLQR